jgi:hypothetical protein
MAKHERRYGVIRFGTVVATVIVTEISFDLLAHFNTSSPDDLCLPVNQGVFADYRASRMTLASDWAMSR